MKVLILILIFSISHITSAQSGTYTPVEFVNGEYSQEVQDLREYGAQVTEEQAIQRGELPKGDYAITETYSVEQQIVNGINYKYEVELSNQENVKVRVTYVVYYTPWTDHRELASYTIDWISTDKGIISIEEEHLFGNEEESFLSIEEEYLSTEEEFIAEEEELVGEYIRLDLDYVNTDKSIQEILNYGVEYVTQSAASQGRLPDSSFTISEIYSVSRQIVNGANYKCDVEITDGQGLYVRTHFEIYSQPWTCIREVTYYSYQITSIPGTAEYEGYEEGEKYSEEVVLQDIIPIDEMIIIPEE